MVPAEIVARAVAMFADAGAQLPHFGDERRACHTGEVTIQVARSSGRHASLHLK
jgi:hypothetical protein